MTLSEQMELLYKEAELLYEIAKSDIPDDLVKAAQGSEWEKPFEELLGARTEAHESDKTKVISMQVAIEILTKFENDLCQEVIDDPAQVMIRKILSPIQAGFSIVADWESIWNFIKLLFDAESILVIIANYILLGASLKALLAMHKRAGGLVGEAEKEMRRRAFPQSSGKRYWRTRRTLAEKGK